jgi:hypothetical protein
VEGQAERLLGARARRHEGIFTREDARAAGIADGMITSRLRSGLWVRDFGRAIRASTTPTTVTGRERAALARIGECAALSHLSAARRWGLGTPVADDVWVTVPASRRLRPVSGIRLVRSRHMSSDLIRYVESTPVLEPARTVADLALVLDQQQLTAVALSAMQRRLCRLDDLKAWHKVLCGRPGSAELREALEQADPAFESILAAQFGELIAAEGIILVPAYRLLLRDGRIVTCDFADAATQIDFEVDGLAHHSTPEQIARDKARDRRLLAAGWVTVRYDTHDVRSRQRMTIEDVRRQMAVRRMRVA